MAKIVCLDPRKLGREFAGRIYDEKLLGELPQELRKANPTFFANTNICEGLRAIRKSHHKGILVY